MGILVGVPHTGNIRTSLVELLLDLDSRDDVEVFFSWHRPVDANRNKIVSYFLEETDHDKLLMVDSDVVPPDNVLDLADVDAGIVSALVFSLQDGVPYPVAKCLDEEGNLQLILREDFDMGSVVDVDAVGTGCVMIDRDVFDVLEKPFFSFVQRSDGKGVEMSEDYRFCLDARREGVRVAVDSGVVAGHISEVDLKNFSELVTLAFEMDESEVFSY